MAWFYKSGEQEIGPVDKSQLQQLINERTINARTLIRRDGETEWKLLAKVVRPRRRISENGQPIPDASPEAAAGKPAPPGATTVCSQCGRSFPKDQVLEFEGKAVCGACKPMFVQRMREGIATGAAMRYAGFWIRFVAKFIDGIIMGIVQWAILIPLGMVLGTPMSPAAGGEMPDGFFMLVGIQQLIGIVIPASYNTFFVGKFSATPGKMACGLRVVLPDGDRVSYARALGRHFAELLSAITLMIGYIMAAFDSEKRALHDRVCSTRVVRKQ